LTGHWRSRLQSGDVCDRPITSILSYLILLGGFSIVFATARMVILGYSSLPFAEGWLQISVAAKAVNPLSLDWLWQQHLEHRFLIPKLFLAADLLLFHASQVFLLASIFAIQLLHLALLGWSMRVLGGWRGALWRTGFGAAAFCLFFPSQWENFVCGFEVNFVLSGLFASTAFIGLLLYWLRSQPEPAGNGAPKLLLLSILAALGATLSLANGNLLWPLLVGAALLLRLRFPAILSLIVSGTVAILVYFHHYTRPADSAGLSFSIHALPKMLEYLAIYLGASWTTAYGYSAMYFGIAGIALLLCLLPRLRLHVDASRAFSVELVLTLMYFFLTAAITTIGRANSGLDQAFSSRYQSFALLFWWALLLLLGEPLFHKQTQLFAVLAQLCLLAIMLGAAHVAADAIRKARAHGFELNVAAASLLTGTQDRAQLQLIYPEPEYLLQLAPYMREKRLSIFAGDRPQTGQRLDAAFDLASPDECIGAVQSVETVPGDASQAFKISGWAWDRQQQRPPVQVVATANGMIIGLGAMGGWLPAVRATHPDLKTSFVGFIAYVKDTPPSTPVSFYGVLDGNRPQVCLFANWTPGVR
jgi:hypothetical protein